MSDGNSGTFAMVPTEVLATGNGYAIAVYAAIAQHANREGSATPSIPRLMQITGWSKPTIIKALATLCKAGALVREHRFHRGLQQANSYTLILDKRAKSQKSANVQESTTFTTESTSLTLGVKEIDSRGKPRLPELEVLEPEDKEPEDPPTPQRGRERFDQFWKAYPRKVGKGDARKWWNRHKPDDELLATMLAALDWQCQSYDWRKNNGQYIPHPTTWLNQGRWEDERPVEKAAAWTVIENPDYEGFNPLSTMTPESEARLARLTAEAKAQQDAMTEEIIARQRQERHA